MHLYSPARVLRFPYGNVQGIKVYENKIHSVLNKEFHFFSLVTFYRQIVSRFVYRSEEEVSL